MIQWEWIGNLIGPEGTKSISEALKVNSSLQELSLIRDEEIWKEMKWKKCIYKEKTIIGNSIGDEGAKSICDALRINTSLTTLNLDSEERIKIERENKSWTT